MNYAILRQDGTLKACSDTAHFRWFLLRGGKRTSKVRYDLVGHCVIETVFTGRANSLDGPQLWWAVTVTKHRAIPARGLPQDPSGGFLSALAADSSSKSQTLEALFNAEPDACFKQFFATKELAITEHKKLLKLVRAEMRRIDKR